MRIGAIGLGVVVAALFGAGPASALTINVDTNVQESPPVDDNDCSFQEALLSSGQDAAFDDCEVGSGADVINLQSTTYNITTPLIVSDNEVTIDGDGQAATIIDANDASGVIQVSGPNDPVLIQDLTIRDGLSAAGGGIRNFGDLALDQVTVTSNETSGGLGGGINSSASGKLNVLDSSIDANVGFGIHNEGTLTVTDSSVSNNTDATGPPPDEGGINNPGVATIDGSTISGNSDSGIGSVGTLTVTDTVVSGNTGGPGTIGGGISILANSMAGTTTVLDDVTITGNSATGGGGVANGSQFPNYPANLTITDSTIHDNDSEGGGGIANFADAGTTLIERTTISANMVGGTGSGGGLSTSDDGVTIISNSTISGNTVGGTGCCGGAIQNSNSSVTIANSTISGNMSPGTGGIQSGGTVNMGGSILANNTGGFADCAATINSLGYNLIEITDPPCIFTGDTASNITGIDPILGPLNPNGGPTSTHALIPPSPAINAGSPSCPPPGTDQRGVVRQPGRVCDIGSFEIQEEPVPQPSPQPSPADADTAPPDTQITAGPKAKSKSKTATFRFSGVDARLIAGFECRLDGGGFAPCTSPHTVKVKKGRHTFSVRATDQDGNVDGSPATDDWKVKKKKRK